MLCADNKKDEKLWYVLRVTYQREIAAKEKLCAIGIESFVPMIKKKIIGKSGKPEWKYEAALHNYIFVHSTREKIDCIKKEYIPWLRYVISPNRENGRSVMTVQERQMQSFIAIAGNESERILYLNPDEINLTKGDRVRVVGGVFEGAEGYLVKIEHKREKRVVVKIDGITAVATTSIPSALVEKID
jgi:transcription antitermination factor NusG